MNGSTLALTPVTDTTATGAGANAEPVTNHTADRGDWSTSSIDHALQRGGTEDYPAWLDHIAAAGGCTHPIQLRGTVHTVAEGTGRIITTRTTGQMPDGVIYKACGNRRATVCPSCAEIYRADTYQLVLAGMAGGKGVPTSVQQHPSAFATFTAPSFGLVHSRRERDGRALPCRPRRKPSICPHGVPLACNRTHKADEKVLGHPLCLECYDHAHQVVWNVMSGELWRRTMEKAKSLMTSWAHEHGVRLRMSFAKVAEMQARGVAHFHALVRIDGVDPDEPTTTVLPVAALPVGFPLLADALRDAVASTRFRTPPHPDQPDGWLIEWGNQVDVRAICNGVDGTITDTKVAGYLAKYATKATEATGHASARITAETIGLHTPARSHTDRLIEACWRLGRPGSDLDPDQAARNGGRLSYRRLRRWAHMLGFGGHFSTKSRRYSTTLRALREARVTWRREHYRTAEDAETETTLIVGELCYADTGWLTTGDALLANTAAAKAREHRRVAREQIAELDQDIQP